MAPPDDPIDERLASFAEISRLYIRALKARYRDQESELTALKRHIKSGDVVCDLGANKGSFTYWLSRWCGARGQVVAFEPQKELAHKLAKVCTAIGFDNVKVEAKAVDSASGFRELYIPVGYQAGASLNFPRLSTDLFTKVSVPVVSLDDYFGEDERISAMKIDVEGAELDVFSGAKRILRNDMPLLIFECENRHLGGGNVHDVFGYLRSLGYEGCFCHGGKLHPISLFEEAVHQRQNGDRFWKKKDYCNNFIFYKRL